MIARLMALSLCAAVCGCTFSRTVTNGFVRRMDTSWIEPGKTTREDIVKRFGYPPAMTGIKGGRGSSSHALGVLLSQSGRDGGRPAVGLSAEGESDGAALNTFRWSCVDSDMKMFEGGWFVYPTFSRQRQQRGHDIYILFDDRGVVRLLSRTEVRDGRIRLLEWKEGRR